LNRSLIIINLQGRLELEVAACLIITEVKQLFRECETKLTDLQTIAEKLEEKK